MPRLPVVFGWPATPASSSSAFTSDAASWIIGKVLEEDRSPARRRQQRLADGLVIAHEVELGLAPLREEDLARMADRELAPVDLDHLDVVVALRHRATVPRAPAVGNRRRRWSG